jgi:DNA topoisomerase-3
LSIAQALYEIHKVTTYPRTDCEFLPEEQIVDVPEILGNLKQLDPFKDLVMSEPLVRKAVFNTGKISAHHAIIPTKIKPDLAVLSEDERNGYLLIARSYLAMLLPDYEYDFTKISMDAAGVTFSVTGSVPTVLGWKMAFGKENANSDDVEEGDEDKALPKLADGTSSTIEQTSIDAKKRCSRY